MVLGLLLAQAGKFTYAFVRGDALMGFGIS